MTRKNKRLATAGGVRASRALAIESCGSVSRSSIVLAVQAPTFTTASAFLLV